MADTKYIVMLSWNSCQQDEQACESSRERVAVVARVSEEKKRNAKKREEPEPVCCLSSAESGDRPGDDI